MRLSQFAFSCCDKSGGEKGEGLVHLTVTAIMKGSQDKKQRLGKNAVYCLTPHGLLSLVF